MNLRWKNSSQMTAHRSMMITIQILSQMRVSWTQDWNSNPFSYSKERLQENVISSKEKPLSVSQYMMHRIYSCKLSTLTITKNGKRPELNNKVKMNLRNRQLLCFTTRKLELWMKYLVKSKTKSHKYLKMKLKGDRSDKWMKNFLKVIGRFWTKESLGSLESLVNLQIHKFNSPKLTQNFWSKTW